jgi:hypothetical protein
MASEAFQPVPERAPKLVPRPMARAYHKTGPGASRFFWPPQTRSL